LSGKLSSQARYSSCRQRRYRCCPTSGPWRGGAAPAPWVVGRSAGATWRGVAPAARQRSAV